MVMLAIADPGSPSERVSPNSGEPPMGLTTADPPERTQIDQEEHQTPCPKRSGDQIQMKHTRRTERSVWRYVP